MSAVSETFISFTPVEAGWVYAEQVETDPRVVYEVWPILGWVTWEIEDEEGTTFREVQPWIAGAWPEYQANMNAGNAYFTRQLHRESQAGGGYRMSRPQFLKAVSE